MQFTGCGTALVTPFQPDFSLGEAALQVLDGLLAARRPLLRRDEG